MSVVDEIKQRLDIVAVIARAVPLQKAGRSFRARCPFHEERTPSFYVFPDGQSWHCFGACGTGGDVFSFVMKRENFSFGEALRLLADEAGVALPERAAAEDAPGAAATTRLLAALEEAAQYYHQLLVSSAEAGEARSYLRGRGLTAETVRTFLLGYSPPVRNALHRLLGARGYSTDELVEAGLLIPGESGVYDRFRGRVMFPLRDPRGRLVGFGARSLDGSPPKYLNSPQTPFFDKGGLLYGLDLARDAVRRAGRVVIVEGYLDAIMAHQAGFANVVASMGTALTERQVRLLRGLAPQIVLALDADTAGEEATLRGVTVLAESLDHKVAPVPAPPPDLPADERKRPRRRPEDWIRYEESLDTEIRVAVLPAGQDPDEVIRASPEAWRTLVAESLPVLDYVLVTATAGVDLRQPKEVSRAADRVLPFINEIHDPLRQAHALQRVAHLLQVDERALQARRAALAADGSRERMRRAAAREPKEATTASAPGAREGSIDRGSQLEELCLALVLQHPECAEAAAGLSEEHFSLPEARAVMVAWRAAGGYPQFWDVLDPALHEYAAQVLSLSLPPGSTPDRIAALRQCRRRLEERRLRQAKAQQARLFQEAPAQAAAVSRLSLALWRGQDPPPEGNEAGEGLLPLAEAQRQGLYITERLRALFYETESTTPSGNQRREGDRYDG
ncbi:MAG: DNA primase [Chloroflexi bacterium]|nr:DNA primase [Chloroflexota bacterium]